MRYFKLQNSKGEILDITTTEILFHEISGLGFEEDNEFRSVGPVWSLNSTKFSQTPVSGKVLFSEEGETTPYQKFQTFKTFISKSPLVLIYYPFGIDGQAYNKRVRASSLDKTEINEYGVLDCDIEFVPYTPWYLVQTKQATKFDVDEDAGWTWDVGNVWDTQVEGGPKYKFGAEPITTIKLDCEDEGLIKLTILGPAVSPTWAHYVNGELVAMGGFDESSPLTILENERLVIDNTDGSYSMYVESGGTIRNVYPMRNFDWQCFFTLKPGINSISASSADDTMLTIVVEGHILYATV